MLSLDCLQLLIQISPVVIVGIALVLDRCLGEPTRWHPLVGFGALTQMVERTANRLTLSQKWRYFTGILSWALLILPLTYVTYVISSPHASFYSLTPPAPGTPLTWPWLLYGLLFGLINAGILYLCIGWKSLVAHVDAIRIALAAQDLPLARQRTQYIVSRNTDSLNEQQLSRSGIESLLENGNDAIFGCIFWFLVAGAPGAVLYRLANTLDAMWGYRTDRYRAFGWASAKIDDALNWAPARLCALSYALLGNTRRAFACWTTQAKQQASPNGGPVMCSGAGSLQIILGGATVYHGKAVDKPFFGEGEHPTHLHITRAITLVNRTVYLWFGVLLSAALLYALDV